MIPYYSYPGIASYIRECSDQEIFDAVCEVFQMTREQILQKSSLQKIAFPRMVIMYIMRKQKRKPYWKEITDAVGKKNHTTAIHACKVVQDILDTDQKESENVHRVIALLNRPKGEAMAS